MKPPPKIPSRHPSAPDAAASEAHMSDTPAQEAPSPDEAWLDAKLSATMQAFGDLPPELAAFMREELEAFTRTHPAMTALTRRLRPRVAADHSGTVVDPSAEHDAPPDEAAVGGAAVGGKRRA